MMNFKVICFDMDGTIIDRNAGALNNYKQLLAWDNPSWTQRQVDDCAKELLEFDNHGNVEKKAIFEYYRTINPLAKKSIQAYIDYWYENTGKHTVTFKDTYEVLEALRKKFTLVLLTNGTMVGQRNKIKEMKFDQYFDKLYVSEEIGYQKPDQRTFRYVIDALGCHPSEMAYVGDHEINDMKGSKEAGMVSIFVSVNDPKDVSNIDYWVSNLSELKRLLLDC